MKNKKNHHDHNGADVPAQDDGKTVIRVRRGALRRFDQLTQKSAGLPVVVEWDRRTENRRTADQPDGVAHGEERRKQDRRQAPPFTWEMADFVVVGDRSGQSEPAAEKPATDRRRRSGK